MSLAIMKEIIKIRILYSEVYVIITNAASPVFRKKTRNIQSREKSEFAEKNYQRRMARRESVISEIFDNNFSQGNIFITLTFDPAICDEAEIRDIECTHKEFKKFIQRMNRRYEDFLYAATFSRQNNGAWHYHMITNLVMHEGIDDIQNIWGNGSCTCKNLYSGEYFANTKDYLCDNMEEFEDEKKGRHGYLCSKNVVRAIVLRADKPEDAELFQKACEIIDQGGFIQIGETEKSMGITKQTEEEVASGTFDILFKEELTDKRKKQGYREVHSKTETYLSTLIYPCINWFPPKKIARLRDKIRK